MRIMYTHLKASDVKEYSPVISSVTTFMLSKSGGNEAGGL